ncbi:MAG: CopG family ribbon-helix-helix protein [Infirmifilum sp.]
MRRVSVTLPDDIYRQLEELEAKTKITNRSRLIGDAITLFYNQNIEDEAVYAGSLVTLYDHSRGETVYSVVDVQHDFHEVIRVTTHVHLTEEKCVEVTTVLGKGKDIKELVSRLRRISGVLTVQYNVIKL